MTACVSSGTIIEKAVLSTSVLCDSGSKELSSETVAPRRAAFCVVV